MADASLIPDKLSIRKSAQLVQLMEANGGALSKTIYRERVAFAELFNIIMTDFVNEGNASDVGHSVLAMAKVKETFLLFASRGQALIKETERENNA